MEKKNEMIGFKTTPEIKNKLQKIADEEERSLSWLINKILKNYLDQRESADTT